MNHFLIFIFLSFNLFASNEVSVTVDKQNIINGESVILTVSVNNATEDPNVTLPNIPNFKIISGPNQSSSTNMQFINGQVTKSSTISLEWILSPRKSGKLTIPSIAVLVGKIKYKSLPIEIIVSKSMSRSTNAISQFFIEAEVDNTIPYRGEQVTLTYILYTQVDVTSFDEELPQFKGLWTEELFSPKNLKLRESKKDGVRYYSAVIKKIALFPTHSKTINIEPMVAVIGIKEKQQRWNDFSLFGPPSKKHTISTNSVKLEVQALPEHPDGIVSSAVGDWEVESSIDKLEANQDEAFTYKVSIKGVGNLKSVDFSDISFPNEFEVFEPKIEIQENLFRDKIGGSKEFEWVLIPRFSGEIVIPSIEFCFFNPKDKKWINKSTSEYLLSVEPNKKIESSNTGLSKEEINLVGEDIRFIEESQPNWRGKSDILVTGTSWMLFFLSGLIFLLPYINNLRQEIYIQFSNQNSTKHALKTARKLLESSSNNKQETYTLIYKSMVCFVNMKTGAKKVEYSNDELMKIIKKYHKGMAIDNIMKILIRGESVRYASVSSQSATKDLNDFIYLLEELDHGWS